MYSSEICIYIISVLLSTTHKPYILCLAFVQADWPDNLIEYLDS